MKNAAEPRFHFEGEKTNAGAAQQRCFPYSGK
jgi:hypothetical protein